MHTMQTFVADAGHNYSAPYWMGEFGCGGDSENWEKIVRFLNETDHDFGYWSIDGYVRPGQGEAMGSWRRTIILSGTSGRLTSCRPSSQYSQITHTKH